MAHVAGLGQQRQDVALAVANTHTHTWRMPGKFARLLGSRAQVHALSTPIGLRSGVMT